MVTLYIVRHGETVWNTEKRMQGRHDSSLTERGVEQAELLAERLKNINFSVIYSSPLGRTVKTSQIIGLQRNLPIIKEDRLIEMDLGDWEGLTQEQILKKNEEQLYNFWNKPQLYISDGGEEFSDVRKRIKPLIKDIENKHDNEKILLVTHSITLKTIMSNFEGRSLEKFWESPYIHQASVSIVEINNGQATVITHGDSSHLGKVENTKVV